MKLDLFLNRFSIKQKVFAKHLGISEGYMSELVRGATPSMELALAVERASAGWVTLYDWGIKTSQVPFPGDSMLCDPHNEKEEETWTRARFEILLKIDYHLRQRGIEGGLRIFEDQSDACFDTVEEILDTELKGYLQTFGYDSRTTLTSACEFFNHTFGAQALRMLLIEELRRFGEAL